MRSRLGRSMGRALIAHPKDVPEIVQELPYGTSYRPMDRSDIEAFLEQSERLVNLSEDLRRLAAPENFLRIMTITEVPSNYGRKDIAYVIKQHCNVVVEPRDIVFRFKRWGRQADTCYVRCPTAESVDHCVQQIQELAVPKRAAHGALFGALELPSYGPAEPLFLQAIRLIDTISAICQGYGSKMWVFSTGWQEVKVHRHHCTADKSSTFFMQPLGMG
ncbi:Uncharacterized protein SCF082_LOCUS28458 [Durusdinium trenchii]|uniref:Uncharacterized protein n=1 Tax=Durusdinium trenchii TaxID=1381693 RepID=A0ABP0MMI6_9DINO